MMPWLRNYEYGQTSARTKRIGALMQQLAELSRAPQLDSSELTTCAAQIERDFPDDGDTFVNAAHDLLTRLAQSAAEDGGLDGEEREELAVLAGKYEHPVSDEPVTEIAGKRFVLTGDFATPGGKDGIAKLIAAEGGRTVKGNPSRMTSYVVVGELGSEAWAFGSYGQKVKRALDLQLAGQGDVRIVSEAALLEYFEANSEEAVAELRARRERFRRQWAEARTVHHGFEGLTAGQQQAFDAVRAGKNVYLSGLGGTGKSYVLERIIEWARGTEMNVLVCAPTGIAALNVGGSTIHRTLGIFPEETLTARPSPRVSTASPLYACDLMIVDEISMCRLDLFDYLSAALRQAARLREADGLATCQLVVVGDFSQLPPVVPRGERKILNELYGYDVRGGYPFMGRSWTSWGFERVELVEAIRQRDADFVAALNAVRVGDTAGLRWIETHAPANAPHNAVVLCGTNAQAEAENKKHLDALSAAPTAYHGAREGQLERSDMPTAERLVLKPGARVMALVNRSPETYMNGSLGTVTECAAKAVTVRFDGTGREVSVKPHVWDITRPVLVDGRTSVEAIGSFSQIPLKLAHAITIHKAQGQTFEAVSVFPECWDPGQLYTALSRATDIEGLHLVHPCPDASLVTSQDVIDFQEGRPITHEPLKKKAAAGKATPEKKAADAAAMPTARTTDGGKRAYHRWSAEEDAFIMAHQQASVADLATRFGATEKAVAARRAKLRREHG